MREAKWRERFGSLAEKQCGEERWKDCQQSSEGGAMVTYCYGGTATRRRAFGRTERTKDTFDTHEHIANSSESRAKRAHTRRGHVEYTAALFSCPCMNGLFERCSFGVPWLTCLRSYRSLSTTAVLVQATATHSCQSCHSNMCLKQIPAVYSQVHISCQIAQPSFN